MDLLKIKYITVSNLAETPDIAYYIALITDHSEMT